jgi:uncharacterized protein YkwD
MRDLQGSCMSDNYAIRRYHRQTMPVLGVNRNKKYLKIFLVILLAGAAMAAYFVYTSGILADENPRIPQQFVDRINLERQANNLPAVHMDPALNDLAAKKSREVSLSPMTNAMRAGAQNGADSNLAVIPKISWAISGYDAQQQMFETLENNDNSFRANLLNRNFRLVGLGVSSDGYNYYIVTSWQ